ncbi:MAG: GDSL-type esterase/lipase family protein [Polyangia bacterium]
MSDFQKKISGFFERIGMIVFTLTFFFLLVESCTRVADIARGNPLLGANQQEALFENHPYLLKTPRPGAEFNRYHVNSRGFRGAEFELPKPKGTIRLLTLGGSGTWDPRNEDDETWSAQLQRMLNERSGEEVRYEVINGGVPGYNSAESLMNFIWRGAHVDPDGVLVYQGYNDFKPNREPGFEPDYSHFRDRDASLARRIVRSSRFLYYFSRWLPQRGRLGDAYDEVTRPGIEAFSRNLRNIVVLARDRDIVPLLATYGMSVTRENHEKHPEKLDGLARHLPRLTVEGVIDAHRKYNRAVRELGELAEVPVADVAAAVPQDFEHFGDHCHYTKKGARLVAETLAPLVKEHLRPGPI